MELKAELKLITMTIETTDDRTVLQIIIDNRYDKRLHIH